MSYESFFFAKTYKNPGIYSLGIKAFLVRLIN